MVENMYYIYLYIRRVPEARNDSSSDIRLPFSHDGTGQRCSCDEIYPTRQGFWNTIMGESIRLVDKHLGPSMRGHHKTEYAHSHDYVDFPLTREQRYK